MNKGAIIGGGVLLAIVVGLAIWVGSLRRDVKNSELLLAEVTRQRNESAQSARDAVARSVDAGAEARQWKARAAIAETREASSARALAKSKARIKALTAPKSLPDCMDGLAVVKGHVALLEGELALTREELAYTKRALASTETQVAHLNEAVDDYAEALRLDDARFDAIEQTQKAKRRKRIVGITLGTIAVAGASFGGGVALGKSK